MEEKRRLKKYSLRAIIGIVMIVSLSFLLNMKLLVKEIHDFKWKDKDSKTIYVERFDGITKFLPKYGIVGYISDVPQDQLDLFVNMLALQNYLVTQYALTPLIVTKSPHRSLIIGNFSSSSSAKITEDHHLVLVKDLGNGVMLFRRKTP